MESSSVDFEEIVLWRFFGDSILVHSRIGGRRGGDGALGGDHWSKGGEWAAPTGQLLKSRVGIFGEQIMDANVEERLEKGLGEAERLRPSGGGDAEATEGEVWCPGLVLPWE